jgi:hypothetical protein
MQTRALKFTTVKLDTSEVARLPKAPTIAEGVRLAIAIAADRDRAGSAIDRIAARVTALERAIESTVKPNHPDVLSTLEALETAARVVRIETFLLLIAEAQARFLEHYGGLHASVERIAGAFVVAHDGGGVRDADARWNAARDRVLERLFDPFDLQLQAMAQAIATPGAASLACAGGARRRRDQHPKPIDRAAE